MLDTQRLHTQQVAAADAVSGCLCSYLGHLGHAAIGSDRTGDEGARLRLCQTGRADPVTVFWGASLHWHRARLSALAVRPCSQAACPAVGVLGERPCALGAVGVSGAGSTLRLFRPSSLMLIAAF